MAEDFIERLRKLYATNPYAGVGRDNVQNSARLALLGQLGQAMQQSQGPNVPSLPPRPNSLIPGPVRMPTPPQMPPQQMPAPPTMPPTQLPQAPSTTPLPNSQILLDQGLSARHKGSHIPIPAAWQAYLQHRDITPLQPNPENPYLGPGTPNHPYQAGYGSD